jgi:hypothetical protein
MPKRDEGDTESTSSTTTNPWSSEPESSASLTYSSAKSSNFSPDAKTFVPGKAASLSTLRPMPSAVEQLPHSSKQPLPMTSSSISNGLSYSSGDRRSSHGSAGSQRQPPPSHLPPETGPLYIDLSQPTTTWTREQVWFPIESSPMYIPPTHVFVTDNGVVPWANALSFLANGHKVWTSGWTPVTAQDIEAKVMACTESKLLNCQHFFCICRKLREFSINKR